MHAVLGYRIISKVQLSKAHFFIILENANELHYGIDAQPHGVEVEDMREFLRILLIEALLKHLRLLEVGLLTGILTSREEDLFITSKIPRWKSSSKIDAMNLESTCWSAFCFFDKARFILLLFSVDQ